MTVGFYSPMPPARTGVADYAAALVAELRRHGRVKMAPDEFGKYIETETVKWGRVVKEGHIMAQ